MDEVIRSTLKRLLGRHDRGRPVGPADKDILRDGHDASSADAQPTDGLHAVPAERPSTPESPLVGEKSRLDREETPPETLPPPHRESEAQRLLQARPWLSDLRSELRIGPYVKGQRAQAEPIVNVTIGRIEVRADPPQIPKQRERRAKPTGVMSLDEYLSQRIMGGNQ
jgi:hypothetical protein